MHSKLQHSVGGAFAALLSLSLLNCAPALADTPEDTNSKTTTTERISERKERRLSEITITADPFNHSLLEHGAPASVIPKEQLLLQTETTLGETIGLEPGVSSSYFGPGASRPVIRGNAGDRVRILKNGIGTLDVSNTSEDHAVSSNPLAAESIEILRGPETLLFGSSAIGGVVNITDNSIPEEEIGAPLTGAVDYRQGTADDELTGAAVLEGQIDNINWHLNYFHQDTNDIDIPGQAESQRLRDLEAAEGEEHEDGESGTLPGSATRSQGFTAGGSYVWERGFVGISVNGLESKYGVPGHAHEEGHEHGHGDDDDEHGDDDDHDDEHDDDHDEDHGDELGGDHDDEHDDEHDEEHGDEHDDDHGDMHEEMFGEEEEEESVAIDMEQLRVDVRGRIDTPESFITQTKFKLGAATYEHTEVEDGEVGTKFDQDALEGRVELNHELAENSDGSLGFQLQLSEFSAIGEEAFLPEVDTFSPAIFLFEELRFNDYVKLQAGARYDFVNYSASGFADDEFHPFGFSTGVVLDPNGRDDYSVGLSVAYTQRAPSASELYANGAHVARQIFEVGDENLSNEESYGFDLTFKKNTGLVTGTLNFFLQEYADYINLDGTSAEDDGLPVFNYESIRAVFWGFEAEATVHLHEPLDLLHHDLDLEAQVDFVRARNKSDSNDLPRIPPLRTIVALDYKYDYQVGARVEGVFVATQTDTSDFELGTDAYQLLNVQADYLLPIMEDYNLSLYVRGTNLTDEEARVHSSFIKDLAPLRGRNFLFGFRGEFS